MQVCISCKKVGREIRYCNKDCQRANWKEHKRECGKEFNFGSLQDDVSPITMGRTISLRLDIPPVAPDYRRTPYLAASDDQYTLQLRQWFLHSNKHLAATSTLSHLFLHEYRSRAHTDR
ncbi:hypothetical protein PILCRDRAFT_10788 [Piloderma croceum F 1598]|uniref:MYND-type domain-containing protein n=1 Tax=Piloderma croceum (strain F 1598) TaxID=765440 RepID=A0A0C3BNE4_PILCF|nr:hypothetical protein PILCRDRAFT_10788 [Piloderma croceum F 1598]